MNVVKFDLEISRKRSHIQNDQTVLQLATQGFSNDLESGGDIATEMRNEWSSLEFPNVVALNSSKYLTGYTTIQNIKVFVFEKVRSDVRGRNNATFQVIALGDSPVQKIFNSAVSQIRAVLSPNSLSCSLIQGTRIYIYPFDTAEKDIYSHSIVVRADLASRYAIGKLELGQWSFLILVIFVTTIVLNNSDTTNNNLIAFYWSVIGSCVFVFIIDLFKFVLVPLMFRRNTLVEITDLSSVVETERPLLFESEEPPPLLMPENEDSIPKG